jgi:hypothetical protein
MNRNKMCKDKRTFTTENAAIGAALGSSKTFGKAMRWYRCPICGKWHVTSKVR